MDLNELEKRKIMEKLQNSMEVSFTLFTFGQVIR